MEVMDIAAARKWGADQCQASSTPGLDADVLLAHALACSKTDLYTRDNHPLPWMAAWRYRQLIRRRRRGMPVAYLVGEKEFFGLPFIVTRDVETETLVKRALEIIQQARLTLVYDVGTGSGNIAVTIATRLPNIKVVASDVFPRALAVAGRNAKKHGVARRIELIRSDLGSHITAPADLIVANLPYVPTSYLPQREIFYEPAAAVFASDDGLGLYKKFLSTTPFKRALIELGPWQLERLMPWLKHNLPKCLVEILRDESGYVCGLELNNT
jgi:release factor glutamine methyltransferase